MADTRSKQGWLDAFGEWRAKRWNDRRAALISDIPSWRLMQELKKRGDLVYAEEPDLGQASGGSGSLRVGAYPVDRNGLRMYRLPDPEDEDE